MKRFVIAFGLLFLLVGNAWEKTIGYDVSVWISQDDIEDFRYNGGGEAYGSDRSFSFASGL